MTAFDGILVAGFEASFAPTAEITKIETLLYAVMIDHSLLQYIRITFERLSGS